MRGGLRFRGLGLATGLMVVTLVVGCSSAESSDDPGDGAVPEGEGLASYDQIVLGGEDPAGSEDAVPPTLDVVVVPAGTRMTFRLAQPLSTDSNRAGDRFYASLVGDVVSPQGDILVHAGSRTDGVVAVAQESQSADEPTVLQLRLESLEIGGEARSVRTTIVETEVRSQTRDSGGETAAKIGLGTAAGALVGGDHR